MKAGSIALLLLAAACSPAPAGKAPGALRVQGVDTAGAPVSSQDAVLDFGLVGTGLSAMQLLTLENVGETTLVVRGFEKLEGDAVSALPGVNEPSPVFGFSFEGSLQIPPKAARTADVTFHTPSPGTGGGAFRTVLRVSASGPAPGDDEARITILGTAVHGDCDWPTLDFGDVTIGDTFTRSLTVANTAPSPRTLTLSEPGGAFALAASSPAGTVTLQPGASVEVTVVFTPTSLGETRGQLPGDFFSGCAGHPVLVGSGVTEVLAGTPSPVDFGTLAPGQANARIVTLSNSSFRDVTLSGLATLEDAGPSTVFSLASPVTSLTVPPGLRAPDGGIAPGTATLTLQFAPAAAGTFDGTLRATTGLVGAPDFTLPLHGAAGP